MEDRTGAPDPGHFAALIDDLMWSAQPHLTRANVQALTRVVPRLLSRLRAGLATVDYPPQKTSEFFEVLMHLHQRGFKGDAGPAVEAPEPPVDANRVIRCSDGTSYRFDANQVLRDNRGNSWRIDANGVVRGSDSASYTTDANGVIHDNRGNSWRYDANRVLRSSHGISCRDDANQVTRCY